MPTQPETRFKRLFDRWFDRLFTHRQHGRSYRTAIEKGQGQRSGLPDRFYARNGHAWVESKVEPYRLSELQLSVCRRLARSGCRVLAITRMHEDSCMMIDEFLRDGHLYTHNSVPVELVRQKPFWRWMLRSGSPSKPGKTPW